MLRLALLAKLLQLYRLLVFMVLRTAATLARALDRLGLDRPLAALGLDHRAVTRGAFGALLWPRHGAAEAHHIDAPAMELVVIPQARQDLNATVDGAHVRRQLRRGRREER